MNIHEWILPTKMAQTQFTQRHEQNSNPSHLGHVHFVLNTNAQIAFDISFNSMRHSLSISKQRPFVFVFMARLIVDSVHVDLERAQRLRST
jgi:hypothetical protein